MKLIRKFMSFFVVLIGMISPRITFGEEIPPNIIIILADDMGYSDLSCYGSKYHRTPHIDQFAKQGMRFTQGYASCPVCSPSRAGLLTGHYPARIHLTDWLPGRTDRPAQALNRPIIVQHLPEKEVTLAEALKKAGYVTGHIGKWHLGNPGSYPEDHGFDLNIGGTMNGSPPHRYFSPYGTKKNILPNLENAPANEYITDRLNQEAIRFIEKNQKKPFFLYLAHFAVHIPLNARKELIAKYKPGKPGSQGNPIYAAMMENLDGGIGKVLQRLDELKLAENTIVIFTSDNGGLNVLEGPDTPSTSNAPLREGKGYLYEGGIREPFIFRWPKVIPANSVCNTPICNLDLFPTLLVAAEAITPEKANTISDGVNILPLLQNGDSAQKSQSRDFFWHYPHYSNQGGKPGCAIRSGDYKLIEFFEDQRRELFDLKNDPGEIRNLSEEKPELVKELTAKLQNWRKSIGAQEMTPNPNYLPNPQAKNGAITMMANTARVYGTQLRYEASPHKNTLGFWTRVQDYASWEFTVSTPGKFTVELLQGCGKGQGGSEVEVRVDKQSLSFIVEDTGHFQNFKPKSIGEIEIGTPGRYSLVIKPKTKKAGAIMDLRSVSLKPVSLKKK